MHIQNNIAELRKHIPDNVKLVCVSKFHPAASLMEAYNAGERIFGESRVQELIGKQADLPGDIQWHFIGHLQSNKIKQIIPFVSLIHGVDSMKLLHEINKQAEKGNRKIACLLQIHIAEEETKFGFSTDEILTLFEQNEFSNYPNIEIKGLMCMATYTDNTIQIRKEFNCVRKLFDTIKESYFSDKPTFCELSMGMSHDYPIAIEEGSTMIRIGTSIFGEREY